MEGKYKQTVTDFVDSTYKYDKTATIKNILQKTEDYSESINKPLLEFTKQDFINLFNENKWVNGRSNFSYCKSRITRYLFYLHDTDTAASMQYLTTIHTLASLRSSDLSEEEFRNFYFGSEEEFLAFIDSIPMRFIIVKISILLQWVGFSRNEIAELTREDLDDENYTIASRQASKEVFEHIKTLSELNSVDYIDGLDRHRTFYVSDSKYLVRPLGVSPEYVYDDKIDTNVISVRTNRMFDYLAETNSVYASLRPNIRRLSTNNKFCILYRHEIESGVHPKTYFYKNSGDMPVSFQNQVAFSRFVEQYLRWRSVFHGV